MIGNVNLLSQCLYRACNISVLGETPTSKFVIFLIIIHLVFMKCRELSEVQQKVKVTDWRENLCCLVNDAVCLLLNVPRCLNQL